MNIMYRKAVGSDASELTNIAFAAKRHWDYPEKWILLWTDDMTVDPGYVENNWILLAETESRILGWCAVSNERGESWLDHCWVLPEAAGNGIGRTLVRMALGYAAKLQSAELKVISDPNAEGFYRKLGFRLVGEHPSTPKGRRLPILEANVANAA